ncbi:MAG: endonuclease/exonuclease/phosphatase family protein [Phycisphaerae bacterium]|nr:endonuclease/exonuclease/phosphatase family protein [Phycisphaerae bacterium]
MMHTPPQSDAEALEPSHGGSPHPLRVLTFNTFLGRRLDEVSQVLRTTQPDIAFLQELVVYRYSGWAWNQAEGLAREFGMDHVYQRIVWRRGTEIGLAVLTRGKLIDPTVIEGTSERPTGISARVSFNGRSVSVAAVHLASVPRPLIVGYPLVMPTHRRQTASAIRRLEELGGPAIMAGDLNTIPGTPAHRLACRHMTDAALTAGDSTGTRRTLGVPLRIDYVFTSSHFTCQKYRVLPVSGSDHRPVEVSLAWNDGPPASGATSDPGESRSTA